MYSWLQRLKSLRHGFWYGVSERIRWSRGAFEETPAGELCIVDREQGARIAALRDRYQVQYESSMSAATSINNYEYLDILDRGWRESQVPRPSGGVLCDIGCASFWYAATLQAFFHPDRSCLAGVASAAPPAGAGARAAANSPESAAPRDLFHGQPWAAGGGPCGALVHRSRPAVHGARSNLRGVEQASIDAAGTVLVDASITLEIFVFISKLL
jgi:hypothetical protein